MCLLRFGLANGINTYLRLKILFFAGVFFNLKCVLIEFAIQIQAQGLIYFCILEILKLGLKISFGLLNTILNLKMCAINSQRLFVVEKLVSNAFWNTNTLFKKIYNNFFFRNLISLMRT